MMRKSIAIGLLSALGAFSMMQPKILRVLDAQASIQPSRRQINKLRTQGSLWNYPPRDGHSVAHGKRMAKKRRNQQRHRQAMKG